MKNLSSALRATFYHTMELATCIIAAVVIMRYFSLGDDEVRVVIGVVVNALVKFARAHPSIPVEDYTRPQ